MNTPQTWSDIGFEVEITGDGSPSLRLLQGTQYPDKIAAQGESMHHSGGAAEETELIYGTVITKAFNRESQPHFLSVGLGLGYVELTVARDALLKRNLNFTLESFELVPELKSFFISWLKNENLSQEITAVYDDVLSYIIRAREPSLAPEEVKTLLIQKLENQEWSLKGALDESSRFLLPAHVILFDAFSSKTTPTLWTEEFLVEFFKKAAAINCVLSTYACRTSLKRALAQESFLIEVREGFKSKRNSTVAYKQTTSVSAETSSHTR